MKKIFLTTLLILLFSSVSYGAVSNDLYVRQDVFDAKMEALFERLHGEINELRGDIKALSAKIEGMDARLSTRIDGVDKRIDGVDKRIDDLRNGLYLWLVIIGLVLSYEPAKKFFQAREERREKKNKYATVDDVKRIVMEAIMEAQIGVKTQI